MNTDDNVISQEKGARLRRLASLVSLIAAVILVVVKLAGWVLTGSVALLSSAIDALVDTAASLATFYGVRYAERPADEDHRFGHGKGEAVAGFMQAAFLGGAAIVLGFQSVERLVYPQPVQNVGIGLYVIIGSLGAAIGLVVLQSWVLRKTNSAAIAADRAHYITDVTVNVAVLVALGVTHYKGAERADPIFALGISGYMLWNSRHIGLRALTQLLDHEMPLDYREEIKAAVLACHGVRGIHDLRTRDAGDRVFVEFHLEVDADLTVQRGHAICDHVEREVKDLFKFSVDVSTHLEPAGIQDDRLDDMVARETP